MIREVCAKKRVWIKNLAKFGRFFRLDSHILINRDKKNELASKLIESDLGILLLNIS